MGSFFFVSGAHTHIHISNNVYTYGCPRAGRERACDSLFADRASVYVTQYNLLTITRNNRTRYLFSKKT